MTEVYYYYKLIPSMEISQVISLNDFMANLAEGDKKIVQDHFSYMEDIDSRGKLLLGGPFLDLGGIILILKVNSEEEAEDLVNGDPIIRNGLFYVEDKHPFQPSIGIVVE